MKIVTYSIANLIKAREEIGLQNAQLARKIPNMDKAYLSKLQAGKIEHPRIKTVRKIGYALGVVFVMGHPDGDIMQFSPENVYKLRVMQNLSRASMSEESGCKYHFIRKIEKNIVNTNLIKIDTIKTIGNTLGVRFY